MIESSNNLRCQHCGAIISENDNVCPYCKNVLKQIENNQINVIDNEQQNDPNDWDFYRLPEDIVVQNFILKEMNKAGIGNAKNYLPEKEITRKIILRVIFLILLFIFISSIFFHFPKWFYIVGFILLIVLYSVQKHFNLIKYFHKQLKSRPAEKISNIIMKESLSLKKDRTKPLFFIGIIISIVMPMIIFLNPRIIYEPVEGGYAVRFYTFGVTNFTTATIPSEYKGKPVVSLRGNCFSNMGFLRKVTLPDTITEIRGQAFLNDNSLEEVKLPKKLEYLGGSSFKNCSSLKEIEIPDSVTYMGGETFYNATSLEKVKLSKNLKEIRGSSFENCSSLKEVIIPDSVTRIGGHAFNGCKSLSNVQFTENSELNEIGSSAFRDCYNLNHIILPDSVEFINERAFKNSCTNITSFDGSVNYISGC